MKKMLNGELIDMSEEEASSVKTYQEEMKKEREARIATKTAKETNEASAITKLKALGLTDDEITAIRG
tara:strand:- start:268 stop:471 length:204 start_codon:yes stop_codon:yes gene_type:complete